MSSRMADVPVPPRCRDMIRAGALIAVNTSSGKDSQAMTILLSRRVPCDRLVAVHAPLGEVDWPGTVEHVEATLPRGVPLILAPAASGKSRVAGRGSAGSSGAACSPGSARDGAPLVTSAGRSDASCAVI